jgi:hypothetical protein
MLRTNEGHSDRIVRVLAGIVAAILAFARTGGTIGVWILGVAAVIAIATGITGICWVYKIAGISTCPIRK